MPIQHRETGKALVLLAPLAWALVSPLPGWAELIPQAGDRVILQRDDAKGDLTVLIDGKEAFHYRYGPGVDLPHYYPLLSPSGKPLTVQKIEPYPHHRSVWFADAIELAGHKRANIYAGLYTQVDPNNPRSPFRECIQQVEFLPVQTAGEATIVPTRLVWIIEEKTPALDEHRILRVSPLKDGEYLLDLTFKLTASYGDVSFVSDAVHYAWPFVRIHPQFSVDQRGTITNSEGGKNQAGTNMKPAVWVDYSNTVEGSTEGLAMFSPPENGHPHAWLTRDYGTFGPRRIDALSGKPFQLKKGESLTQRVGILIHKGDARDGQVAERYQEYVKGVL